MPHAATLLAIVRAFVGFVATTGFLFSQLYFGTFSLASTVAGVAGLMAALVGSRSFAQTRAGGVVVVMCAVLGVFGVLFSAYEYYTRFTIPGNNFGWFLVGPFLVGLAVIAFSAMPHASQMFRSAEHNGG